MSTRSMMDVTEIVNELGVSKAFAYNLIKKFNNELKQKGFTTITGKVSRKYRCRFYCLCLFGAVCS